MKKFYFLFRINMNMDVTLYSFGLISNIGRIYDNSIKTQKIGNYNGKILALDNTNNGINYLGMLNDIELIVNNYTFDEIKNNNSNILLGGYIISDYPEIEVCDVIKLEFNISKYFEVNTNKNLISKDVKYKGLDINSILRDKKLNDLGI